MAALREHKEGFLRAVSSGLLAFAAIILAVAIAHGQSPTLTLPPEGTTVEQKTGPSSDETEESLSPDEPGQNQTSRRKRNAAHSSSCRFPPQPAVGSGLLLITAYVFKLNQED